MKKLSTELASKFSSENLSLFCLGKIQSQFNTRRARDGTNSWDTRQKFFVQRIKKGDFFMQKFQKISILFLLSILFFIPAIHPQAKQTATYVKSVDGDTAKLKVKKKTYTFRFLAIDTPETVKPGYPVAYCGKKASNFTKKKLQNAKKIQIQYNGTKSDKYGRRLAWIWVDGKLLQNELVKKGYARVYYIYGKYQYTDTLRKSEKIAKRKKLGIWKNYSAAFPDARKSNNTKLSNVWVSRSGTKYHTVKNCCGMKNASRISIQEAKNRGLTPCKICSITRKEVKH